VLVSLLTYRADTEARSEKKFVTPLMFAPLGGRETILTCLIQHFKAYMNAPDYEGCTALHWACRGGSSSVVRLLLEARADPAVEDNHQRRPLDVAEQLRHPELRPILLANGAPPPRPGKWHERQNKFERMERICTVPAESSPLFGCKLAGGPTAARETAAPRICSLREAALCEIVAETRQLLDRN